ncbi:MAG: ribonuclease D [Myxococcota bacterium]
MSSDGPLIHTAEQVEALARRLRRERAIALDTEADSFFHYYDKVCLIQIGTRSDAWLLDPLELPPKALAPLARLLADPAIRIVLHAAEYDLYVLHRYGGVRIRGLFDTMVSAQLLGYRAVGLSAMVEEHFGVVLAKDQQRTDWSRRPLRPKQVEYARTDVRYLIELADKLEAGLRAKKRLEWALEEFRTLEDRVWPDREFDAEGYLKIKGARKLGARGLAVLRELYLMRDHRAREIDRPPFKVLGNGTMIDLAQRPPRSKRSLSSRKGVSDLVMRRMGDALLAAVRRGLEGPELPFPERKLSGNGRRRLDRRAERTLEVLKRWRQQVAAEEELDPGVFCPNSALEQIAAMDPRSLKELRGLDGLKGWWIESFGERVIERLAAEREERSAADPQASPPARSAGGSRASRRRSRRRKSGRGEGTR